MRFLLTGLLIIAHHFSGAQNTLYIYQVRTSQPMPAFDSSIMGSMNLGSLSTGDSTKDVALKKHLFEKIRVQTMLQSFDCDMEVHCGRWAEGTLAWCNRYSGSLKILFPPRLSAGSSHQYFNKTEDAFVDFSAPLPLVKPTGIKAQKAGFDAELYATADSSYQLWISPQLLPGLHPIPRYAQLPGGLAAYRLVRDGEVTEGVFVREQKPALAQSLDDAKRAALAGYRTESAE